MNAECTIQIAAQPTEVTAERLRSDAVYTPSVDIRETPDELTVLADMPGLRSEDIDIKFENGMLTIHGEISPRQGESTRFLRREYGVGCFERSFQVGEVIDSEKITAEYADGVLKLHLPKVPSARPRRIAIKSA